MLKISYSILKYKIVTLKNNFDAANETVLNLFL